MRDLGKEAIRMCPDEWSDNKREGRKLSAMRVGKGRTPGERRGLPNISQKEKNWRVY